MHGARCNVKDLQHVFVPRKDGGILSRTGCVDFAIGDVNPGVFLIVTTGNKRLRDGLVQRDMGPGPYYTLFRPYHLCSIEVPLTCALLAIRRTSNMVPLGRLVSEVFAVAKRDLALGETLDGIGGSTFYSLIDRYEVARAERLLPVGLAKGARVVRPIPQDRPIALDDVALDERSTVLALRRLQDRWMDGEIAESELFAATEALPAGPDVSGGGTAARRERACR